MKLVMVYNPRSGSALGRNELLRKCSAIGIEIEAFVAVKNGFELQLTPHIKAGKNIAVIGGDGTIGSVASCVAGTNATLIPLPGGTLNHFTNDLKIPQNIDEALQRLSTQHVRRIDIGNVNETRFINNSSIGLYPATLREREKIEPYIGKWLAAVVASWRAFIQFNTYTVIIDDECYETAFVFIGNNRYILEPFGNAKRSQLDEGTLTVFVTKVQSRRALLKDIILTLVGKHELAEFDVFHPSSLKIQTTRQTLFVSHDGEMSKLRSPLNYAIESGALRVLA